MIAKSERFEMRLDPDLVERVDKWRMQQGHPLSRSEAIRRLVEDGLNTDNPKSFRPTKQEMLTTWLLSQILGNQVRGTKNTKYDLERVDFIQEVITGGHFWALSWEMPGVFHDHADDPQAVKDVVDILDTWDFIEEAYEKFDDASKSRLDEEVPHFGKSPKFLGFDGNNENEHLGIVRFLVEKLGRFQRFKGRDFNSHVPTVARYLSMANRFESYRHSLVGRSLNVNEAISLLKRD